MKINLYNDFHNGDIFYSRIIIEQLLKNGFEVSYNHGMNPQILSDYGDIYNGPLDPNIHVSRGGNNFEQNIINTWIGKEDAKFVKVDACSFRGYVPLANEIFDYYGIKYDNEEDILPVVRFDNLPSKQLEQITDILYPFGISYDKIIMICNNNCLSGQSENFDFDPIISHLSANYPKCLFLVTNDTSVTNENVLKVSTITGKVDCDLLLISYISKVCDIIVGRASGPYCYTHIKENLLDDKKTYISFTYYSSEGIWHHNSKSKQVWSDNYNLNHICETIENEIKI